MGKSLNPFGLHSVTPYLIAENVEGLIDFLVNVFVADLMREIRYLDDKTIQHAAIKIGNSIIMMGEPSRKFPKIQTMSSGMYVYDCEKVYERALKHGGHLISEPMNYPHRDRYAGIKDFAGNIWWIVTHIGK